MSILGKFYFVFYEEEFCVLIRSEVCKKSFGNLGTFTVEISPSIVIGTQW